MADADRSAATAALITQKHAEQRDDEDPASGEGEDGAEEAEEEEEEDGEDAAEPPPPPPPTQQVQPALPAVKKKQLWVCAGCTFQNDVNVKKCTMCNSYKVVVLDAFDDF